MTEDEWQHGQRMADEGEVVEEIEISDEELARITTHEALKAIALTPRKG